MGGGVINQSISFEYKRILLICFLVSAVFCTASLLAQQNKYSFFKTSVFKKISVNSLYFVFGFCVLLASIFNLNKELHGREYISIIKKGSVPADDSDFYLTEFVPPKYENIIFPDKKKNLIIILMESMESSYSDKETGGLMNKNLIPNLTSIARESVNFSNTGKIGGGTNLSGTGWTIAAMLSKFGGLPFNLTGGANTNKRPVFMPGTITLTDILAENGYQQLFIFGSDKHFASRDVLLETHGNVEIHDIAWYKEHDMLPKDYGVFWGFEDKKLYEFAKYELENLKSHGSPFMFGLLTVDTHAPTGWQCEDCPSTEDMPIKNTIICADEQVFEFLEWCKKQPWYADTTIVIMGDHLFHGTENANPFGENKYITFHRQKEELSGMSENPRRWLDIFINASPKNQNFREKNRKFSSFDMFPTILASLGCEIKGERLGFGVNLFSDEKTLCEEFSEDYINAEIMARNKQYESMETGVKNE